jgi:hypothetical protein
MGATIEIKTGDLQARLGDGVRALPAKLAGTLTQVAKIGAKEAVERIEAEIEAPHDYLDQHTSVEAASAGETPSATIRVSGERISLRLFNAVQTTEGVTYQIAASGTSLRLPHAFGPDIEKLHHGVFMRKGKKRLPIRKLFGPSPAKVLLKGKGLDQLLSDLSEKLELEGATVVRETFTR